MCLTQKIGCQQLVIKRLGYWSQTHKCIICNWIFATPLGWECPITLTIVRVRPQAHYLVTYFVGLFEKSDCMTREDPQLVLLVQKQPSSCLQSVLLVSFVTIWRSKRAVTTWLLGLLRSTKRQGSGHLLLKDWGIWIMDSCWKNVPNFFKDLINL